MGVTFFGKRMRGTGTKEDQWLDWLCLKQVRGVGNRIFLKLLDRFDNPSVVFQAQESDLLQVIGLTQQVASDIVRFRTSDTAQKDLELVLKNRCTIVTILDQAYPALLRDIHDPPPFLYVFGSLRHDSVNMAVVGSRHATHYGKDVTRRLCVDLAGRGITVVSGMARGIDSAAHEGALSGNGDTIAVLGCGLGRIYPAENKKLFHRIGQSGAVVSEFPFLTEPEPHHFPIRNRIISGMSWGTLVVEATLRSGSLITAQLAADQGRDVFAVPGNVTSFKSTGTHSLIKQGAKLVEQAQDIVDELPAHSLTGAKWAMGTKSPDVSPEERAVLEALEAYPTHIDRLIRQLATTPADISNLLLHLELKGLVTQCPGKHFIRTEPGLCRV